MANTNYSTYRGAIVNEINAGNLQPALALLCELVKTMPLSPGLLEDMSLCYWKLGDAQTAIKLARIVAKDHAGSAEAHGRLGAMCLSTGAKEDAAQAFEAALAADPKNIRALAALNRITPIAKNSTRAATLRKTAHNRKASKLDRATAYNTLGQIEARAGHPAAAFYNFGKSKHLSSGQFDSAAQDAHVAAQIALCPHFSKPEQSGDQPQMVFITGLPRSGTTLVQSILTAHPDAGTVGETPALTQQLNDLRKSTKTKGWNWLPHLDASTAKHHAGRYLADCAKSLPDGLPPVLVDKTPLNLFEMGFARLLFPTARFVFMSRHPLDTALSNFSTNFHAAHPFSKTPTSLAAMTRAAYASAEDYAAKIGSSLRWQSYTALVKEPKPQIAALLSHIGLPWDETCLTPERQQGIIRTASLTQVRRPINTKGLGKWKPFETELEPLIAALGGWDWINAWEEKDRAEAQRL